MHGIPPYVLYLAKVVGCMLFICYLSIGHDLTIFSRPLIAIQLSYVLRQDLSMRMLMKWDPPRVANLLSCPGGRASFIFFPRKRKTDTKSTKRRIIFIFIFQPENEKWNQNNELGHRMI